MTLAVLSGWPQSVRMQSAQIEAHSHHPRLSRRAWILIALSLSALCHLALLLLLADVGAIGGQRSVTGGTAMNWVVSVPSIAPSKPAAAASNKASPPEPSRDRQIAADVPSTPPAPAPSYLPRGLLQQAPVPISEIDPVYPEAAGGLSGSVVLRLRINEVGGVDSAEVVSATRPGLFDQAAIDAFSAAKFEPGRALGRPVKSELVVEVAFATVNKGAVRDAIR